MIRSLSTAVLLLLLALPSVALAQNSGKLSGRVTDAETGDPLIGANVFLADIQRGAATDIDGNYTILGIPVGAYAITYSYTGYQSETLTGVEISQGRTRTVDVELSGESLGEVVVEYERPLIQRDAIGVPKVVTGEDIQNLPVRGVQSVAAIQAGVVSNDGSGTLNIRGGRGEEVDYYVDGVKVVGSTAVPQQAIAEQEMLIGTIPPQYGDATAGVISISTRGGGNSFFGAAEAISSYGLDSFGYALGSLSLGGPIIRDRVSFFGSVQGTFQEDASPYAVETLQLNDDVFDARSSSSPQLSPRCAQRRSTRNGVEPFDLSGFATARRSSRTTSSSTSRSRQGFNTQTAARSPRTAWARILGLNGDHPGDLRRRDQLQTANLLQQAWTRSRAGPARTTRQPRLLRAATSTSAPSRASASAWAGRTSCEEDRSFSFDARASLRRNRYNLQDDDEVVRGYASLRQVLSNTAFYQLQAEYSTRETSWSTRTSSAAMSATSLFYGDIDAAPERCRPPVLLDVHGQNEDTGDFVQQFSDGNVGVNERNRARLRRPGQRPMGPITTGSAQDQFRAFGNAQTQIGVHELSFGGEYETLTQRRYALRLDRPLASSFARFFEDGTDGMSRAPSARPSTTRTATAGSSRARTAASDQLGRPSRTRRPASATNGLVLRVQLPRNRRGRRVGTSPTSRRGPTATSRPTSPSTTVATSVTASSTRTSSSTWACGSTCSTTTRSSSATRTRSSTSSASTTSATGSLTTRVHRARSPRTTSRATSRATSPSTRTAAPSSATATSRASSTTSQVRRLTGSTSSRTPGPGARVRVTSSRTRRSATTTRP